MTDATNAEHDREAVCGAPHPKYPTLPSAGCVLPAGHEGDHHDRHTSTWPEPEAPAVATPEELERGTKTCPQCAEEVKAAALVCRFCGHRFDAPLAQAATLPSRDRTARSDANTAPAPAVAGAQVTLDTAAMLGGAVLIAIGSIGPWATSPITSASGTSGDGVITLIAAVVLAGAALLSKQRVVAALAILVAGGVGIYDVIHIHNKLASATLDGVQIDHVGWGLYVVVVGAVIALVGLLKRQAGRA